ncbi:MAG: hypothetical protein OEW59_03365, partial [Gammaproteobacteria bacterium]|nr:hypothetical protein [Gammaproteobacteria bacterium]
MAVSGRQANDRNGTRIPGDSDGRLADAELLAILLGRGAGHEAALCLAGALISRFGGLRQALNATPAELGAVHGIGSGRVAMLGAARELARRYFEATLPVGHSIRSPADTETFLQARLR